jgi:transcriptional regulator with XRE-family HTH domain
MVAALDNAQPAWLGLRPEVVMHKKHKTRIGREIRKRREALGFSLRELEAKTSKPRVGYAAICHIENGNREPTFTTLSSIAKALDCNIVDLIQQRKER